VPRRNYKIFKWEEGETISDRNDDVQHNAHITVVAIAENSGGGGKYILRITDDRNLDNSVLFEVVVNTEGRVTHFQACPDIQGYPNIKVEGSQYKKEVVTEIVYVMGNDLGDTLYTIHVKHKRYVRKAFEFEVTVYPTGELSYIQESPDEPLVIADEDDSK
jgi:hypothetical protein